MMMNERETTRARTHHHHPSSSDDPNLALAIETTSDDRCERRIAVRVQTSFSPDRWKPILKVHDSKREGGSFARGRKNDRDVVSCYAISHRSFPGCRYVSFACVYVQTVRETDDPWVLGFRVYCGLRKHSFRLSRRVDRSNHRRTGYERENATGPSVGSSCRRRR